MSHRGHNMHGSLAIVAICAAIAFAFGGNAARVVVGAGLIACALAFAYIAFRVVMGTI